MIIHRDFNRTEDDWNLNVQPILQSSAFNHSKESVPIYNENDCIVGWMIQDKYE